VRTMRLRVLSASSRDLPVGIAELHVDGLPEVRPPRAGRIQGCDQVAVLGGDALVGLRVDGDIRDLDAGKPVRASGCRRLPIAAGPQRIEIPAATLRPDSVLLTSPAPSPIARAATTPGSVTDPGDPGRGRRDDVKLDVDTPAWLVLGESFDRGWRAWCNDKSLGEPIPIDGFANGWPVEPGCTTARFAFAPQKPVHVIQLLSALACLALLAIALAGGRMRRRDDDVDADWPDPAPARIPATRAAMAGIVFGGALAFCFSLRSGVLIAPGIAFVLWRGIPAKPLAVAGGLLLAIAVPFDYILFPAPDFGGYNPGYAGDQVSGHWIAVAAWVLLALALWRTLSTASRRPRGPSAERAGGSP
jgi:arabinofuranan 3-O-arabinosyltransferase